MSKKMTFEEFQIKINEIRAEYEFPSIKVKQEDYLDYLYLHDTFGASALIGKVKNGELSIFMMAKIL